jgi:uncharacterized protein YndB with AHSA1/START domain
MMNETDSRAAASDALRQVHIARVIRAPREAVFRAWSDKDRLARWFAPNGCTIRYRAFDFHEGGAYHSCIRTPDPGNAGARERTARLHRTTSLNSPCG